MTITNSLPLNRRLNKVYDGFSAGHLNYQIALVGDSRFSNAHNLNELDYPTSENYSIAGWVSVYSDGAYEIPPKYNFAVGGSKSYEWQSQMQSAIASPVDIIFMINPINDFGGADLSFEQSKANLLALISAAKRAGKIVVIFTGSERFESYSSENHYKVRDWIRSLQHVYASVIVSDPWDDFIELNNTIDTTHDNLHWSPAGAQIVAWHGVLALDKLPISKKLIQPIKAAYDQTSCPWGNLIANFDLANETGGTSYDGFVGNVPDNFVVDMSGSDVSGITYSGKKGVEDDGRVYYEMSIKSDSSILSNVDVFFYQNIDNNNISDGDTLVGTVFYKLIKSEGCTAVTYEQRVVDANGTKYVRENDAYSGLLYIPSDNRIRPLCNGAFVADTITDLRSRFYTVFPSGAVIDTVVRIYDMSLVKEIPLT